MKIDNVQARKESGLTQADLAANAGVSVSTLYKWEKEMPISGKARLAILAALTRARKAKQQIESEALES